MTSGFYKLEENGKVSYAPNFVSHPKFELLREKKDAYNYGDETDGWTWFDDAQSAYDAFGVAMPPTDLSEEVKGIVETLTRALEKEGKTIDDVFPAPTRLIAGSPAIKTLK